MIDDPRALLIGEHPWSFLLEVLLRTGLMFFLVLGLFMLTGKKEVRQFSVLELIVIIGLGSALGDPMLHADTPLLPAIVTIAAVLFLYRAVNAWTNRWQWVGRIGRGGSYPAHQRVDRSRSLAQGGPVGPGILR